MIAEPLVIYRPNCTLWHFAYEQINRIVFVTEEKKNDPSPPASAKNGQIKWFVDVHKWPLNVVEFMQFIIFNVSITNLNDISVFSIKVIVYWQINCHYLIICESTWHAMNTTDQQHHECLLFGQFSLNIIMEWPFRHHSTIPAPDAHRRYVTIFSLARKTTSSICVWCVMYMMLYSMSFNNSNISSFLFFSFYGH